MLFGNFNDVTDIIESLSWSEKNRDSREYLSDAMMSYYNAFARTGDPNTGNQDLPEWTPWSNEKGADKRLIYGSDKISMSNDVMEPVLFIDTQAVIEQIARLIAGM